MKKEELLDIPLNEQAVQSKNRKGFFRKHMTLFSLLGFVFVVGAVCALCITQPSTAESLEGQIINRRAHTKLMQQYSRVLSVEVTPNAAKVPKDSKFQKKIQSENMILNFYPISNKPEIIAIEVIDQQEKSFNNEDISQISYSSFAHEVHKPLDDTYFLVLDKHGQFSKLIVNKQIPEQQLEKIKHIVQQYTPEIDTKLYESPKQLTRNTKLGSAKVKHSKVFENEEKVVVKHNFNGEDIAKTSSLQNLDAKTYNFEETHHFSKKDNQLTHSDLHETYNFETDSKDMFTLGMNLQTHQKLELLKTKEISQSKIQELMRKYYQIQDNSKQVLTLTPNPLKHTSDFEFAQAVKDQLFPGQGQCKERNLAQANDNIQMLTNQTFTVYNHPQQSFLGFSFQIIDEISIYLDLTNQTLIFDNSLVLQIQRDDCFKQFTLIEFTLPMTTNFTFDLNYIEVSADAWLQNLEDFFTGIYDKFQDFLKKIKAEGIHSNSTWTGIDSHSSRELSLKGDLDKFEQDLNSWNEKIIDTLSHTSKQYHYSKPISYEYNLDFYGITLQFSFGFTFGLDGSYTDNLLDLYTYDKQVLISYIDMLVQDYQTDMEEVQAMWKNLTVLLAQCFNDGLTKEEQVLKNWQCTVDDSELDYVCHNNKNSQQIHITKMYHDYMQSQRSSVPNECITSEITNLEQQIQSQLKQFYSLRQTQFLDKINLTYIPQFHGDVYVTGYVKVTLVPWLNDLAMSISLAGDLLNAVADLSLQVDVKPFFNELIQLVQEDITPYQFLQDVESSVSFNFNFDVQVVNVTLTWVADTAVVDFVLDVADVMKDIWSSHTLRQLPQKTNSDVGTFQDIFQDAATKFEQGLEKVIADIYCEFFTNAQGITEAFSPETVPLYQFLWASAGCNLPSATLANFSTSMIQCSYTTDFQVTQLWDPSKYQ